MSSFLPTLVPSIDHITFTKPEFHPKQWGCEEWVVNNGQYCAKILRFAAGTRFSNHFHFVKHETWYVVSGKLKLNYFDLSNADELEVTLVPNDVIVIPPGNPHQLTALEDSVIWEVSTPHFETDSYRIGKGDSQTKGAVRS